MCNWPAVQKSSNHQLCELDNFLLRSPLQRFFFLSTYSTVTVSEPAIATCDRFSCSPPKEFLRMRKCNSAERASINVAEADELVRWQGEMSAPCVSCPSMRYLGQSIRSAVIETASASVCGLGARRLSLHGQYERQPGSWTNDTNLRNIMNDIGFLFCSYNNVCNQFHFT